MITDFGLWNTAAAIFAAVFSAIAVMSDVLRRKNLVISAFFVYDERQNIKKKAGEACG